MLWSLRFAIEKQNQKNTNWRIIIIFLIWAKYKKGYYFSNIDNNQPFKSNLNIRGFSHQLSFQLEQNKPNLADNLKLDYASFTAG